MARSAIMMMGPGMMGAGGFNFMCNPRAAGFAEWRIARIAFHTKAALEQGASSEEVAEALAMAIYTGAGPSVMYASHAFDAFEQFAASRAEAMPVG